MHLSEKLALLCGRTSRSVIRAFNLCEQNHLFKNQLDADNFVRQFVYAKRN